MNDDALNQAIADKRAELQEARKRVEHLEVEIGALELAASLRPVNKSSATKRRPYSGATGLGNKGRQPGAISHAWRNILRMMHGLYPDGATDTEVLEICRSEGFSNMRPRDVTYRMSALASRDYVERIDDTGWRVTATAVTRFSMNDSATETETADDSPSSAVVDIERLS